MEQKLKRPEIKYIVYAVLFTIAFITFWKTINQRSADYYQMGENAIKEGKTLAAIAYFERSALYYTPGSKYPELSISKLTEISNAKGEYLFGILASHAIMRIHKQVYPGSIITPAGETEKSGVEGEIDDNLPGGLSIPHRFAIHASFMLWIGGAFWIFRKGFQSNGDLNVKEAVNGLFTFLISLFVWLFLLAA